ncbi:MAG: carbon-nitrogen hydrolase family protein [Magnetococcales bacterium]|nr:carbon-nitrogen hydrolase family protein [Magnetococcales bacterium]
MDLEPVTAAVIQLCSGSDRNRNLERAGRLLESAAHHGARLLVLPENFSYMGANDEERRRNREDPETSPSIQFLRDYARKLGVWIVGGSISLATEGERVANVSLLVDDKGRIQSRYKKIHLFDANLGGGQTYLESDVVEPGHDPVVVSTPWGVLGLTVCYDLRFPELFRKLVDMGAILFSVPSAFTLTTGKDHWEVLLRARAIENFSYVLAAGQWGQHPGGRRTYGRSMIVDPWGTVVACCPDGEGFAMAEVDPVRVTRYRGWIPCLDHRVFTWK